MPVATDTVVLVVVKHGERSNRGIDYKRKEWHVKYTEFGVEFVHKTVQGKSRLYPWHNVISVSENPEVKNPWQ